MNRLLLSILLLTPACQYLEGQGPLGIPIAGKGYEGPALRLDGQDEAELVVWKWTYGGAATVSAPPPVLWIYGATCTAKDGITYRNSMECSAGDTGCCWGYYNVQSNLIYVTVRGQAISDTSYAHELCHAWLAYSNRNADCDHETECYQGPSHVFAGPDTLVGEANRRLKVIEAPGSVK